MTLRKLSLSLRTKRSNLKPMPVRRELLRELRYQASLSKRPGVLLNQDFSLIEPKIIEIEKVLNGLIKALREP
jgi:hypothetical protein